MAPSITFDNTNGLHDLLIKGGLVSTILKGETRQFTVAEETYLTAYYDSDCQEYSGFFSNWERNGVNVGGAPNGFPWRVTNASYGTLKAVWAQNPIIYITAPKIGQIDFDIYFKGSRAYRDSISNGESLSVYSPSYSSYEPDIYLTASNYSGEFANWCIGRRERYDENSLSVYRRYLKYDSTTNKSPITICYGYDELGINIDRSYLSSLTSYSTITFNTKTKEKYYISVPSFGNQVQSQDYSTNTGVLDPDGTIVELLSGITTVSPGEIRTLSTSYYDNLFNNYPIEEQKISIKLLNAPTGTDVLQNNFDDFDFGGWTVNGTIVNSGDNPFVYNFIPNATYGYKINQTITEPGTGKLLYGENNKLLYGIQNKLIYSGEYKPVKV